MNRVEEVTEAILDSMEEFAPIYGVDVNSLPSKDYLAHVVASLINDGVIEKRQ